MDEVRKVYLHTNVISLVLARGNHEFSSKDWAHIGNDIIVFYDSMHCLQNGLESNANFSVMVAIVEGRWDTESFVCTEGGGRRYALRAYLDARQLQICKYLRFGWPSLGTWPGRMTLGSSSTCSNPDPCLNGEPVGPAWASGRGQACCGTMVGSAALCLGGSPGPG